MVNANGSLLDPMIPAHRNSEDIRFIRILLLTNRKTPSQINHKLPPSITSSLRHSELNHSAESDS
jgi:hypothetical protein